MNITNTTEIIDRDNLPLSYSYRIHKTKGHDFEIFESIRQKGIRVVRMGSWKEQEVGKNKKLDTKAVNSRAISIVLQQQISNFNSHFSFFAPAFQLNSFEFSFRTFKFKTAHSNYTYPAKGLEMTQKVFEKDICHMTTCGAIIVRNN